MGQPKPIQIIQGGQWGSEAKGMVAAALCLRDDINIAVRTGAVNAGHTVWYKGKECKMQQIPVGWVNPNTMLVIGAGAFIYPEILANEIKLINDLTGTDVRQRLYVDNRANLHLPAHTMLSDDSGRHHGIGATGKGCSEAIVDKIKNRGRGYMQFEEWCRDPLCRIVEGKDYSTFDGLVFVDTVTFLHGAYDKGLSIQLEGTQGSLLDLHLGPYPYTTHKQTQAVQWIAECGLAPSMRYDTILVLRTYPIRVAGNSGPMPKEIDWSGLARLINKKLLVQGLDEMIPESSLKLWDWNCKQIAKEWADNGDLPRNGDYAFHQWSDEDRVKYKGAVSEFYKSVLNFMGPTPVVKDLQRLFEMTTVTKKLRRIANFDVDSAKWSIMVNRPRYIALTFLNYEFPELWNQSELEVFANKPAMNYLEGLEHKLGVPILYTSTGPLDQHFITMTE